MEQKTKIRQSPLVVIGSLLLLNGIVVYLMFVLNKYRHLYNKAYFYFVLVLMGVALIVNLIFLLAYARKSRFWRKFYWLITFVLALVFLIFNIYFRWGEGNINKIINEQGQDYASFTLLSQSVDDLSKVSDEQIVMIQNEELENMVETSLHQYSRHFSIKTVSNHIDLIHEINRSEADMYVVPDEIYSMISTSKTHDKLEKMNVLDRYQLEKEETSQQVNVLKEPFTVLLLGNNDGLSDSIILASVNPKTMKVTLSSLSRDLYVPISCYPSGSSDKLNHARASGRQCMIDTVQDLLDVDIDFYVETDFYAIVKVVDALGGLELKSPIKFSGSLPVEGNPGQYEQITVEEGQYLMNGKEVITFARERKHMPNGDFDRQKNQQYVIQELAKKVMASRDVNLVFDLLDIAKDNIVTNIPLRSLNSLIGYIFHQTKVSYLEPLDTFRIVQTQVAGSTPLINGMSVVMPYENDIRFTHHVIQDNLRPDVLYRAFPGQSFSYVHPYRLTFMNPDFAGTEGTEGLYKPLEIPDFQAEGYRQSDVVRWAYRHGLSVAIDHMNVSDDRALIQKQMPIAGDYVFPFERLKIYIPKDQEKLKQVPDFSKNAYWTEDRLNQWALDHHLDLTIYYDDGHNGVLKGQVVRQSVAPGTDVEVIRRISVTLQL